MKVTGEDAKKYQAVRLDSFEQVNKGDLTEANDETGAVSWKDITGNVQSKTLGPHTIRILPLSRYGR